MKFNMDLFFRNLSIVFRRPKYVFLSVVIAILFYVFNVLIANFRTIIDYSKSFGFFGSLKIYYLLILGFRETVVFHSYISLVIISILFGILFSLIFYKTMVVRSIGNSKTTLLATIGIFLGVLAPGCAVCGLGLLPLLGIGAVSLRFLPYDGLELSILSIIILLVAIYLFTKNLLVCKVKK